MQFGMIIGDVPRDTDPIDQLDGLLAQVEAGQRNNLKHFVIGQHFLYGDLRWLQPIPTLARLAAEIDDDVRLAITVLLTPLYNPVVLAEELATLDIMTRGRLDIGLGLGYRSEEFDLLGVPFKQRVSRFEEGFEIMKLCWTTDEFDHHGRHWDITGATPHIHPVQKPYPPIWMGAHSRIGARRAGRVGDRFIIPPEYDIAEMRVRLGIMSHEFAKRGKTLGHQPLRRNMVVGPTTEAAQEKFVDLVKDRYLTYARKELDILDEDALTANFFDSVKDSVVADTPANAIANLTALCAALPIDPIIVKPHWPTISAEAAIEILDDLGREVIPALNEIEPMPIADIGAALAPAADEVAAEIAAQDEKERAKAADRNRSS